MTLDEAIQHCEDVADSHNSIKQIKAVTLEECRCADEHHQLAEWLKELKAYRENTCGDAISRQAALEGIKNLYPDIPIVDIMGAKRKWLEKYAPYFECENVVERLPSVKPQHRIGRWIQKEEEGDAEPFIIWECNECHRYQRKQTTFCPNCGAKMEVQDADSD